MNSLGNMIRERRIQICMTQEELAEKVGYTHRSALSKIETGANVLPASKIEIFAKALRCKPEALLCCTKKEYEIYRKIEAIRAGEEMGI